jgi:hypothetical protein
MLKKEGKITDAVIENMMPLYHRRFHVHINIAYIQVLPINL